MSTPEIIAANIVLEPADEYRPQESYVVWTYWADVDRPTVHGISCAKNLKLAQRLQAAIQAGVVYTNAAVRTDTGGQTYVQATCMVSGKHLNADLRHLGF